MTSASALVLATGTLPAFWLASRAVPAIGFANLVLTSSAVASLELTPTSVAALWLTSTMFSNLVLSSSAVAALMPTPTAVAATALVLAATSLTALLLAATAVTALLLAATSVTALLLTATTVTALSCSRLTGFTLTSFTLDPILIASEAIAWVPAGLALATLIRPGWSRLDLGLALVAAITAGPRTRDVNVILRLSHHFGRLLGHRHGHRRLGHLLAAFRGTELLEDLVHELVLLQFLVSRQSNLLGQVEQLGASFAPKLGAGESIHCTPLLG